MQISVSNTANDLCGRLAEAFPRYESQAVSNRELRVESGESISLGPLILLIEDQGADVLHPTIHLPACSNVLSSSMHAEPAVAQGFILNSN